MNNRKLVYALEIGIVVFLLAGWAFVTFQPVKVLPRLQLSPGYALLNQAGETITSDQRRGTIVLYSFMYTRCGAGCLPTQQRLAELQEHLHQMQVDTGVPIEIVSISLDTQTDSPETLAAYIRQNGLAQLHWRFVVAEDDTQLTRIVKDGFGVAYQRSNKGEILFEQSLFLVDGWGIVRKQYQPTPPILAELVNDITLLASEATNSQGVARLVYEAAHLFKCYSP